MRVIVPMMRVPVLALVLLLSLTLVAPVAASTSQRLDTLERRMDVVTDLALRVESLQQENNLLRGEIELLQHELETLRNQQREMYLDIERRLKP